MPVQRCQAPRSRGPSAACVLRAGAVLATTLVAAALLWRLRPGEPTATATSERDIVLGCCWLAWALGGYLVVAIAASALVQLLAATGVAVSALSRLTPTGVGRLVETTITFGVAAAVFGSTTTIPAMAAIGIAASASAPRPVPPGGALDWPGLTDPVAPAAPPTHAPHAVPAPTPTPTPTRQQHHSAVGLVTGGSPARAPSDGGGDGAVVVQRGDSLWRIAARHLGPGASAAAITSSWHEWYAANRHVVGTDPNLIYPGQRLTPPAASPQRSSR